MNQIGGLAEQGFGFLLSPFRFVMQAVGLHPSDIQVWALLVGLFLLCLSLPVTYGDWVLSRRQRRTTGTVLAIDMRGEAPYSPTIGFTDLHGRAYKFDSSLPLSRRTDQVGAAVEVIYDPLNPKRAREAGRPLGRAIIAIAWYGMAVLCIGYALVDAGS